MKDKKQCALCGKTLRLFGRKTAICDGYLCHSCAKETKTLLGKEVLSDVRVRDIVAAKEEAKRKRYKSVILCCVAFVLLMGLIAVSEKLFPEKSEEDNSHSEITAEQLDAAENTSLSAETPGNNNTKEVAKSEEDVLEQDESEPDVKTNTVSVDAETEENAVTQSEEVVVESENASTSIEKTQETAKPKATPTPLPEPKEITPTNVGHVQIGDYIRITGGGDIFNSIDASIYINGNRVPYGIRVFMRSASGESYVIEAPTIGPGEFEDFFTSQIPLEIDPSTCTVTMSGYIARFGDLEGEVYRQHIELRNPVLEEIYIE